jgi:hypothetical protein
MIMRDAASVTNHIQTNGGDAVHRKTIIHRPSGKDGGSERRSSK